MYNISTELDSIKNDLTNMYIAYNNLINKEVIENRESDNIIDVKNQFMNDKLFINSLRNNALQVFDICNKLLMKTEV